MQSCSFVFKLTQPWLWLWPLTWEHLKQQSQQQDFGSCVLNKALNGGMTDQGTGVTASSVCLSSSKVTPRAVCEEIHLCCNLPLGNASFNPPYEHRPCPDWINVTCRGEASDDQLWQRAAPVRPNVKTKDAPDTHQVIRSQILYIKPQVLYNQQVPIESIPTDELNCFFQ